MKKFIPLINIILVCAIILCSCGGDRPATDKASAPDTTSTAPTTTDGRDPFAMIDYDHPLDDAETKTVSVVYAIDGAEHASSFAVPKLTVDLDGADEMNAAMADAVKNTVGVFFDKLETADGELGSEYDYTVSVDYDYAVTFDVVCVKIRIETDYLDPSRDPFVTYRVFYYDALVDEEITVYDYLSYCGVAYGAMLSAIAEQIDGVTENSTFYPVKTGDNTYDIYYIGAADAHGPSAELISVTVDPVDIDIPN